MTDKELEKIISAAAKNIKMPNQEKIGQKIPKKTVRYLFGRFFM